MSHFATLKTKIINRQALVNALEAMGYTVEVHDGQGVELNTRFNAGHYKNSGRLANVIIRRETVLHYTAEEVDSLAQGMYYRNHPEEVAELRTATVGADVGFTLQPDGTYSITADTYFRVHERIQEAIPHQYAKQVILNQAESLGHGYTVTERLDEHGRFIGWQVAVQPDEIEYVGVSSTYNSASLISQY